MAPLMTRAVAMHLHRRYEKNTYRVVQIPPEHCNVLEVSYKLPGYLATGVSGELTLTFTPKSNEVGGRLVSGPSGYRACNRN